MYSQHYYDYQHMDKKEFVAEYARRAGISKTAADVAVQTFLDMIWDALAGHRPIRFRGFGVFDIHPTTERMARNPSTMEDVLIPAGFKPIFKPSRALRTAVNHESPYQKPVRELIPPEEEEGEAS